MFKLQPNPTFTTPVMLSIAGQATPVVVEFTFKYLSRDEIKDFWRDLEGKTDIEALGEMVVGWKGVDAEFSKANLDALLNNYPASASEIFTAFRVALLESRVKN